MNQPDSPLARETAELRQALRTGGLAKLRTYSRLAGPGWLQSALMLGGGSLAGSLYLGVLTGVSLIWLQPLAMVLTIVMFGALSYVVLSTGEPPFRAINRHINPVLGWSWALASLASCMVWAMPQYSLATGVLQQNLAPSLLGAEGPLGDFASRLLVALAIFSLVTAIAWQYGKRGAGVKVFEWLLKAMVWIIVACFLGVTLRLAFVPGGLDWAAILRGVVPDPSLFFRPTEGFVPLLEAIPTRFRDYWSEVVVTRQRDVMVAVAAAAGGVNATFLLAYSLLRRGWGKEFRGLAVFDLSTGMLIPFAIATSCVVIAAAHQFHTVPQPGFLAPAGNPREMVEPSPSHIREFEDLLRGRVLHEASARGGAPPSESEIAFRLEQVHPSEREMAATLLTRDAFDLASSLEPLTGGLFARIIFSIGVLGMTLSSITLHMLISGMVVCELLGRPHSGWTLRLGSLAAATGILGPFLWHRAAFWLAIPTSVFAFILLPIAYLTFFLMMNKRTLLGAEMPVGARRVAWNLAMGFVVLLFTLVSAFMIWTKTGMWGVGAAAILLAAIGAGHVRVHGRRKAEK
jgi:Mn2+/Fe2+ NRAMP family transporter